MNGLCVNQMSAGYGSVQVLRDLSFSLPSGTVTGVLGANGCGKTTLLKSILGLTQPLSGEVELGDHLEIGYFEQEGDYNNATTCIEEIWKEFPSLNQAEIRAALAKCGLTTKHIESPRLGCCYTG